MVNLMYPGIDTHWTLYVDPVTSIVLTGLILYTTLGLLKGKSLKKTSKIHKMFSIQNLVPIMILLQTVPRSIDLEKLEEELITVSRRDYEVRLWLLILIGHYIYHMIYDTMYGGCLLFCFRLKLTFIISTFGHYLAIKWSELFI